MRKRPRPEKVPMKTQDKILLILLVTILAFVVTVIVFNFNGLQVQDSLINMFLGICGGELVTMGGIQIFKKRREKNE